VSIFQFKQFSVRHDVAAMKVGTDAVLLGAWAFKNDKNNNGIGIDVGCGCGIITLMMAQRFSNQVWLGIDIEPGALEEARYNFENSSFKNLRAYHGDFLSFSFDQSFSRIICNPPYYQSALTSDSMERQMARQEQFLPPHAFLLKSWQASTADAKLAVILPPDRKKHWIEVAGQVGWNLYRMAHVRGNDRVAETRFLLEWTKAPSDEACLVEELILEKERGVRSAALNELTRDFYL
jgi:tRNA1Val (adenine37-N6)-methyltransferase